MAGPIKISVLADANAATKGVKDFANTLEKDVPRAAKEAGSGLDKVGEAADGGERKAQGFRDTLTGTKDAMTGVAQIAKGDLYGGLVTLGGGMADLAGGAADFLVPAVKKAAVAMKALNLTFLTNPIFLVIAAIVALVAIFIIAYKHSETFRNIVNGAFRSVLNIVSGVFNWVKKNWPLLLAILTGPIGLAVLFISRNFNTIRAKIGAIPGWIKGVFASAGTWLINAGKSIISGLWNGIAALGQWLKDKVTRFITDHVPGPIRRALGISSPSRVARQLGSFFGQGLGLGLEDEQNRVRRAASSLAAATIASPNGTSGNSSTNGGVTISFAATGDPLLDAILSALRKHIRVNGGSVQTVLGT